MENQCLFSDRGAWDSKLKLAPAHDHMSSTARQLAMICEPSSSRFKTVPSILFCSFVYPCGYQSHPCAPSWPNPRACQPTELAKSSQPCLQFESSDCRCAQFLLVVVPQKAFRRRGLALSASSKIRILHERPDRMGWYRQHDKMSRLRRCSSDVGLENIPGINPEIDVRNIAPWMDSELFVSRAA